MIKYLTEINQVPKIVNPVLGVDYSRNNVGIAVSDYNIQYAMPVGVITIRDYQKRIDKLLQVIEDYQVNFCVFGMPWRENNLRNAQMDIILNFVEDFQKYYAGYVFLQDESLSTVNANFIAYDLNIHHKKNDSLAASIILQRFLDKYRHLYKLDT